MTALKWHTINEGCGHAGWHPDDDYCHQCGADDEPCGMGPGIPHQWRETPHMGDTCTRCGQRYECTGNAYHEISG